MTNQFFVKPLSSNLAFYWLNYTAFVIGSSLSVKIGNS